MTTKRRVGLILAQDRSTFTGVDAANLGSLFPLLDFVKVGIEAMTAEMQGGTVAIAVRNFCLGQSTNRVPVMWDGKFHDIGNTVGKAARNIVRLGSTMFTLHASASDAALAAAADEARQVGALPLAVTVLTDLDDAQCRTRFMPESAMYAGNFVAVLVENFAKNAYKQGIRGFVCSAHEARIIRELLGDDVTIVTPAIRPLWAVKPDEQKRVTTPTQAARAGADYVVVGRPISEPPAGMSPIEAAKRIREELNAA